MSRAGISGISLAGTGSPERMKTNVAIIGAGPAGLTAGYLLSKNGVASQFSKPTRFTSAASRALSLTKVFISTSAVTGSSPSPKRWKICGLKFCLTTCWCGPFLAHFLRRQIFLLSAQAFRSPAEARDFRILSLHFLLAQSAVLPGARPAQFRRLGKQPVRQAPFSNLSSRATPRRYGE